MKKISVSICVYGKDDTSHFQEALESIYHQTLPPDEVVLVVDGPVPDELNTVITTYEQNQGLTVHRLPQNMGHGVARREGFARCKHDYVAIADADDLNAPNRFELQMREFEQDPQLSAVASAVSHFAGTPDNILNVEHVPLADADIREAMKTSCPICQPAVMLKKADVLKAGGYQDWYHAEDYYLWLRMMLQGAKFKNLPDCLVNMRTTPEQLHRRGGMKYFLSLRALYAYMLKNNIISYPTYLYNVLGRFVAQVLLPSSARLIVRKIIQQRNK